MSNDSDRIERKINELAIRQGKCEQKIRTLSILLEERKITAEDFKVLKFLYKRVIEYFQKEIKLLFGKKSKRFGSVHNTHHSSFQ